MSILEKVKILKDKKRLYTMAYDNYDEAVRSEHAAKMSVYVRHEQAKNKLKSESEKKIQEIKESYDAGIAKISREQEAELKGVDQLCVEGLKRAKNEAEQAKTDAEIEQEHFLAENKITNEDMCGLLEKDTSKQWRAVKITGANYMGGPLYSAGILFVNEESPLFGIEKVNDGIFAKGLNPYDTSVIAFYRHANSIEEAQRLQERFDNFNWMSLYVNEIGLPTKEEAIESLSSEKKRFALLVEDYINEESIKAQAASYYNTSKEK